MKRILIIIGIIIALLAVLIGIYFAWKNSKAVLGPSTKETSPNDIPVIGDSNAFPEASQGAANQIANEQVNKNKLKVLSDYPVLGYSTVGATSSPDPIIFYVNNLGQVLKLIENQEDEIISQDTIENVNWVKSGAEGKVFLVKFGGAKNPQFKIFDVEKKIWQQIDDAVAADFSPTNPKIAYLKNNGDLIIKDLFGSKPKTTKVISINQKDFEINWTTDNQILLASKPSYLVLGEIWRIDIKNKTINLLDSGNGLIINWSKDGKLGISFSSLNNGKQLGIKLIDDKGIAKADLDFFTLPDKCFISQPKIYCGVPQTNNVIRAPILPDDYLKKAVYFSDFIYQIDTNENSFEPVLTGTDQPLDINSPRIFGDQLFFINRYDNRLYGLKF